MRKGPGKRRDLNQLEKRRLEAARLLGKGMRKSEVARRLKVSPMSVTRWAASLRENGKEGLRRADRLGRKSKLDPEEMRNLLLLLKSEHATTAAPTLPEITERIRQRFGVAYHPGHVWRLLRKIGWGMKRPRGRRPRATTGREQRRRQGCS